MNIRVIYRRCNILSSPSPAYLQHVPARQLSCTIGASNVVCTAAEADTFERAPIGFLQGVTKTNKSCDPLRILFFGTDDFSVTALKALHKYRDDLGIESIDVVCKFPKRTGRGLKVLHTAPIKETAEELSLRVHELQGFSPEWQPPRPDDEHFNLLIAVSFGLKIPGGLIQDTKYGGLNLHPSPLPDLRGAAPLHHTLLQKRRETIVSLQTLHPRKFDRGLVLARSQKVQIPPSLVESGSVSALRDLVSPIAAELLVKALYSRVFVPPVSEAPEEAKEASDPVEQNRGSITFAPKITKADGLISWSGMTSDNILHRLKVLGPLWNTLTYIEKRDGQPAVKKQTRIIFHSLKRFGGNWDDGKLALRAGNAPGTINVISVDDTLCLAVWASGNTRLLVTRMTVAGGDPKRDPVQALERLHPGDHHSWEKDMVLS